MKLLALPKAKPVSNAKTIIRRWLSGDYRLSLCPISVEVMTIESNHAVFTINIKTHFGKERSMDKIVYTNFRF